MQFTLDIVKAGYKKAVELMESLIAADKNQNPDWIDPKFAFTDEKLIGRPTA